MTSSSPFSNAPIRILGEQGGACESKGDIGDEGNGCNSNNGAMGNVGPATRATALQQEQPCTSHQAPKRPKVEFGKGLKDHEERQKAGSSSSLFLPGLAPGHLPFHGGGGFATSG